MKLKEKLASDYILNEVDPSDYVEMAPDQLAEKIYLAGFEKAREIATDIHYLCGSACGCCMDEMKSFGEEEVKNSETETDQ